MTTENVSAIDRGQERANLFMAEILRRINTVRKFMGWPLKPVPWHSESMKLANELNTFVQRAMAVGAINHEVMQKNYPVLDNVINCHMPIRWKREAVGEFMEFFGQRMKAIQGA